MAYVAPAGENKKQDAKLDQVFLNRVGPALRGVGWQPDPRLACVLRFVDVMISTNNCVFQRLPNQCVTR